jgi:hypothetical protein
MTIADCGLRIGRQGKRNKEKGTRRGEAMAARTPPRDGLIGNCGLWIVD